MNKTKNKLRKFIFFQIILTIILSIYSPISIADENNQIQSEIAATENSNSNITILSPHAILMDPSTGQILYEHNAREQAYPASVTKLMTAILTMENCKLNDVVTVDSKALQGIPRSYTVAALQPGEQITVDKLLHVLLIPSANDAANVLAFHIAGSLESFSEMMNAKAKEIGCENTHFTNPSGIHDDNHYTSAYDMALIGKYAYTFDTIREIATNTSYDLPNLPDGKERKFKTTNTLITEKNQYYYEYATGLKTGYTDKAKSCIVATAKKDNMELLCVILGGDKTEDKKAQRELDCRTLFEYGFNNYSSSDLCIKNNSIDKSKVTNLPDILRDTEIGYEDTIHILVPNDGSYTTTYNFKENIKLPIKKGESLGNITYTINNVEYKVNLIALNDVYPISTKDVSYLFKVLLIALVLILLVSVVKKKNRKKESRYFKRSLY